MLVVLESGPLRVAWADSHRCAPASTTVLPVLPDGQHRNEVEAFNKEPDRCGLGWLCTCDDGSWDMRCETAGTRLHRLVRARRILQLRR